MDQLQWKENFQNHPYFETFPIFFHFLTTLGYTRDFPFAKLRGKHKFPSTNSHRGQKNNF